MTIYSFDELLSWLDQSVVPCPVLTVASWPAYKFSGVRWDDLVFPSLSEFSTVYCDPHSQRLCKVNKAEIDVFFLELSCFFNDSADAGNLTSGSSAFSETSLNIWKFMVQVLLKPGLENFEHYFTSLWDERNCVVVSIFWHCLSLGLEWKLTFSIPAATAEFSKMAHILSAAVSQHYLAGFKIAQLEFHPSPNLVHSDAS